MHIWKISLDCKCFDLFIFNFFKTFFNFIKVSGDNTNIKTLLCQIMAYTKPNSIRSSSYYSPCTTMFIINIWNTLTWIKYRSNKLSINEWSCTSYQLNKFPWSIVKCSIFPIFAKWCLGKHLKIKIINLILDNTLKIHIFIFILNSK